MENTQKTYPSQVNTKAMACRVPAGDYVKFLQDAISKGISMNDWLLMKVYQEANNSRIGYDPDELIEEVKREKDGFFDTGEFPIVFDNGYGNEVTFNDSDDVISNFLNLIQGYNNLQKRLYEADFEIGTLKHQIQHPINNIDLSNERNRREILSKILDYVRSIDYEDAADKRADISHIRKTLNELFVSE